MRVARRSYRTAFVEFAHGAERKISYIYITNCDDAMSANAAAALIETDY